MKSLFAKTDNSVFLIFKNHVFYYVMFLLCFIVLVSCIFSTAVWLRVHNEKTWFLKIVKNWVLFLQMNSSYNVNEIKGHLSDLKRDIFITVS